MRVVLFGLGILIAAAALGAQPSKAEVYYPWCAQYGGRDGAGTNCGFANLWQCRQAISGNGGHCYENPFYSYAAPQPRPATRGYTRRH